jgi:hypothetical protein
MGLTPRVMKDLDVPPSDSSPHAKAKGLGKGLFGCKTEGEGRRRIGPLETELPLLRGEYAAYKSFGPPLHNSLYALNVNQVNANSVNHQSKTSELKYSRVPKVS